MEKSDLYRSLGEGVRIAECLLLRGNATQVWVIEAKSSAPQPGNAQDFGLFIDEVRDKFVNTLTLGVACCLGRHSNCELPDQFHNVALGQVAIKCVLVIRGHEDAWLLPVQDALRKALRAASKTWNLGPNALAVMNEQGARKRGLVSGATEDS